MVVTFSTFFFKLNFFLLFLLHFKMPRFGFFKLFFFDNLFVIFISVLFIFSVLISVAFFTLLERKKLASIQRRRGPNVEGGITGFLQPVADGIKLVFKEVILPNNSFGFIFIAAPLIAFILGFASWCFLPFGNNVLANINYSVFFIFIISVLHVYSVILAGWSSNSKYSFFGALRSSAQLIAYDLSMGLIILTLLLSVRSFNLLDFIIFQENVGWFVFYYPVLFVIFFVCSLAETNRHPFDLPEAEAELVSGYNVEYSALGFALFFLGEYAAILFMSMLICNLFLGGTWTPAYQLEYLSLLSFWEILCAIFFMFFALLKFLFVVYLFLIARALIPRYRYDQLMQIGWKFILPIVLGIFFYNLIVFYFFSDINFFSSNFKFFN